MSIKVGNLTAYNVPETAELLGTTPLTVRLYIKAGKIQARKIAGKWYVTEDNLKGFISGAPTAPAPPQASDTVHGRKV